MPITQDYRAQRIASSEQRVLYPGHDPTRSLPPDAASESPSGPGAARAPVVSLLRSGLQNADLVRAVRAQRRADELPGLGLGGVPVQVAGNKGRRGVGIAVDTPGQSLAGDLAQPGVVVTLSVDAERMQLVGEVDVGVRLGRRGSKNITAETVGFVV